MPSAAAQPVPRRALVLLVILTLVWGTNWLLLPLSVREISVWTFRAVSLVGAGLLLLAIARLRGDSLAIPQRHWSTVLNGMQVDPAAFRVEVDALTGGGDAAKAAN